MVDRREFTSQFIKAIELEQKNDMLLTSQYLLSYSPKKLASFGLAITNLIVSNIRTGAAGSTIVELALDPALSQPDDEISAGSIRVGDIVKVEKVEGKDETGSFLEGVITRFTGKGIHVMLREEGSDEGLLSLYNNTSSDTFRVWIAKLTNAVTYKRMLQAMRRLESLSEADTSDIIKMLLGEIRFVPKKSMDSPLNFFDELLNDSQKRAIRFAIFSSPITIIHGPPGTGKTYTIIELIKQLKYNFNEKILVCGASNTSVDNILERLSPVFVDENNQSVQKKSRKKKMSKLASNPEKLIRIGHPARLHPANLRHSLDVLSKSNYSGDGESNQRILQDIRNEISETLTSVKKSKRYSERKALWTELKSLKRELREREQKITQDLLLNAAVVLSTLHGSGSDDLYKIYKNSNFSSDKPLFDTIIIDEVSQSLEPQCWIPLVNHLGCRRLVIAGDDKQLPPSVESKDEVLALQKKGELIANLEITLFDRLISDLNGSEFKVLLNVQYRMNQEIMHFPSRELYDGELIADKSVKKILLSDLDGVDATDETILPCIWYDTQGGAFSEQISEESSIISKLASSGSKYNDSEVLVVMDHVNKLLSAGVSPFLIGIISPYSAQVTAIKRFISKNCDEELEVSTIDGFQGREKEAIIVSLVRSNENMEVGFLNDFRRLNVAMTRPKRHLCIVGDMEVLEKSGVKFLSDWAKYVEENFEIRYPDLSDY